MDARMTNIFNQVEAGLAQMDVDGAEAIDALCAELEDHFESDACDPEDWEAWEEEDGNIHFRMRLQNGEWSGERRIDPLTGVIEMC